MLLHNVASSWPLHYGDGWACSCRVIAIPGFCKWLKFIVKFTLAQELLQLYGALNEANLPKGRDAKPPV